MGVARVWGFLGLLIILLVSGARAQGLLELVPAHWWAELGPGISGCRDLGVLELLLACWWAGPVPDSADYVVQGVPKLLLAHWWVKLNRGAAG